MSPRTHLDLLRLVRAAWLLALVSVSAFAQASAPERQLLPIAAPTIDGMETAVRTQLDEALDELRAMLDAPLTADEDLAEAFGGIGQIYLAYDLVTPAAAALENAHRLDPRDFRWLYLLASLQQNEGQLDVAAVHFEQALALDGVPATWAVPGWIRLGNVRLDLDDPTTAASAFDRALGLNPDSAAAWAGLGKSAARSAEPTAAIEHLRRALELQPEADALRYLLAIALRELGQRDAARQELALRGSVEAAFADPLAQSVLALATGSGVHLMYGNRALRQGQIEVAIERYRRALTVNPRSAEAHQSLAAALERRGARQEAIDHYSAALALTPQNPSLHYNLGTLLVEQQDDAQAERHFRAALRWAPEYDNARFNLAAVLARNGRYGEAAPLYEALLDSEGRDAATRFYAAHTFQNLGRHEAAITLLRELLTEDPRRPRARLALARSLVSQQQPEEARQQLHEVLDLDASEAPQRMAAHLELARLDAQDRRWDAALKHFEAVLELDSAVSEAHQGRAMALLLAERYPTAAKALEASARKLPEDVEIQHLWARFLATCPVSSLRHGQQALEMAFDLLEKRPRPDIVQTVAMALAEQGRFEEAIRWQDRVLDRARQAGDSASMQRLEADLERYRLGYPVLAPWLESSLQSAVDPDP